jgi:hypothetical protein
LTLTLLAGVIRTRSLARTKPGEVQFQDSGRTEKHWLKGENNKRTWTCAWIWI